jgi:hypothetical protein
VGRRYRQLGARRGTALEERAAVVRITRSPSKPKPKLTHECRVGRKQAEQPWLWQQVERIAGPSGYKKRSPFWACTIIAFDTKEKAASCIASFAGVARGGVARGSTAAVPGARQIRGGSATGHGNGTGWRATSSSTD